MKKSIYLSIALMFLITISKAQSIPNSGFENWTNMGSYDNPDSWGNLNNVTTGMSIYTCQKGTPGAIGSSYLKLTSKVGPTSVIPGIAVSGVINPGTFQPSSGFAFAGRPLALTGKWQHMIFGSSQGFIDIKLTRWDVGANMRVMVASAHQVLSGMAMSWENFSVPLTYSDSNIPDTCIIVLAASGTVPANNDYLWVDNLTFTSTGISEYYFNANISLFPNPSSSSLLIDLSALKNQQVSLQVMDMQGRLVKNSLEATVSSNKILDISDLSKGIYLLNIISKEGTVTKKFIKE